MFIYHLYQLDKLAYSTLLQLKKEISEYFGMLTFKQINSRSEEFDALFSASFLKNTSSFKKAQGLFMYVSECNLLLEFLENDVAGRKFIEMQ
jgi:hypothetical protein